MQKDDVKKPSDFQLDLFGKKTTLKKDKKQCPYCKSWFKSVDQRHLIHCSEYRKSLPIKEQNHLNLLDGILKTTNLYLPKDHALIDLPDGKKLDFIFVDGHFCGFLFQLSEVLGENYDATRMRYNRLCKEELASNLHGITYKKKITRKRLLKDFGTEQNVRSFPESATYILLREDDMIYLSSRATSNTAKLTTKYLIDYSLKAKKWISDLIYKLGKCNNREFKFLCAWLRLGYALEEIIPQQWYRLPYTVRRVDFKLGDGKLLVEIDAREIEQHDPNRDKPTDRWFFERGKLIIRFMNSEIDDNALKVVRQTINIAKQHGLYIKQEVLPLFIKGFVKNKKRNNDKINNKLS